MSRLLFLVVTLISAAAWSKADRVYVQDKLVRLQPLNDDHIDYLRHLEENPELDFWTDAIKSNVSIDVHIKSQDFDYFTSEFKRHSLPFNVLIDDLQAIIDKEQEELSQDHWVRRIQSRRLGQSRASIVGTYARYNDILTFLEEKANADPQNVKVIDIGRTYESRWIKGVSIQFNPSSTRNIWIDCGIHAREWITPATCVWMIDTLINEYKNNDPTVRDLLNYWTVYIVPSLNPDGYEYSHVTQRLWRKNRSKLSTSTCYGTDLNRNYPHKWMTGGASNSPCSDTFGGSSAGGEVETQGVINFLNARKGTWDMYMSFHSFGQWWFTPYGYKTDFPPHYNQQLAAAQKGATAITGVNNRAYTVGTVSRLLYIASGSTVDWAYENLGIKFSYTIELPPGSNAGSAGFILSPSLAPGVCNETHIGMKVFLAEVKKDVIAESMG